MRLASTLRRAALALPLLAGLALPACAQPAATQAPASTPAPTPAPGGSFTPQQRQDIIAIIREALRTDTSLLREAISALQEEEEGQKTSTARGTIAQNAAALFRDPEDPVIGNPKGDVTIVEFYDVRCPYCRRMVPVMNELIRRDPNVRIVLKDFPILGPASTLAARALLAAHRQGGYARLHETLMTGAPTIDEASLRAAATRAGLDAERMMRDMGAPDIMGRLNANLALGRRLDLQGTPAYVIGEQVLPGAVDLNTLVVAVAAARRKGP